MLAELRIADLGVIEEATLGSTGVSRSCRRDRGWQTMVVSGSAYWRADAPRPG